MGNDASQFLSKYDDMVQKHLELTYAHIANPATKDVVEYNHLREVFKYNYLFLSYHHIYFKVSFPEINFISKAIKMSTSLVILDLSQIQMNDDHLMKLVETGLKYSSTIRELNLSNNDIKCRGVVSLCSFLFFDNKITKLDISNNLFSGDGMKIIGEMLIQNRCLNHLNITGNKQKRSDNMIFYNNLEKNINLLYFRNTFFSIEEIMYVKRIIQRNILMLN